MEFKDETKLPYRLAKKQANSWGALLPFQYFLMTFPQHMPHGLPSFQYACHVDHIDTLQLA